MNFVLDPAFEAGSVQAADWPLCQVRLQLDARFPWLVLIPRVADAVELEDLSPEDRARLMDEVLEAGRRVRLIGEALGRPVEKLNVAALGNVTRQLHLHVVGRRRDDPFWPDPVWGRGGAEAYADDQRSAALAALGSS